MPDLALVGEQLPLNAFDGPLSKRLLVSENKTIIL